MRTPLRRRRAVTLAVAAVAATTLALAGCSSTGGKPDSGGNGLSAGQADTPRYTVAMITHGVPGNAFWDLVQKGAETAAAKDNIDLKYSADPQAPNQANLVQTAIDSKVNGIAVTLAKPDAMAPAVGRALEAGIPVVGLNSGFDQWQGMGVQQFFGQDENIAGEAAGKRLADENAEHVLCIVHEQGNVSLESRCDGVEKGLGGTATLERINVNSADMPSVNAALTAKLQQDPSIDRIIALDASIAMTAVDAKGTAGSDARVATFDTNAALVDAIRSGQVEWAVDQQPFLQGYLAVDSLWLYLTNGNTMGGGQAVLTGPAFIDKTNIDSIAEYAKAGTR